MIAAEGHRQFFTMIPRQFHPLLLLLAVPGFGGSLATLWAQGEDETVAVERPAEAARESTDIQTGESAIDLTVDPIDPGAKGQLYRESLVKNRNAEGSLAAGWAYFDARQWESAGQWFERALEFDPTSSRAAEGLVMSRFRSGDLSGAYALAKQHAVLVPDGPGIVAKAAAATAQQAVDSGELEKAEKLLADFPDSEAPVAEVRRAIASSRVETAVVREEFAEARNIAEAADLDTRSVARDESGALLQQAADARRSGDHESSLALVKKAESVAPLERGGKQLKAWALYENQHWKDSAALFEALYREGDDRDSAEGLVKSLDRLGDTDQLARLSRELGGPLATASEPVLMAAARAEEERQRKARELAMAREAEQRRAAAETMPAMAESLPIDTETRDPFGGTAVPIVAAAAAARFPGDPIDLRRRPVPESSRVNGGAGFRMKSGDDGLDRLRVTHLPTVRSTLVFGDRSNQSLTLGVNALSLDAGEFHGGGRLFGSADLDDEPQHFATETDTLVEPSLAYRLEKGDRAYFAEIGTTPIGAEISATAIGALGVEWQGDRAAAGLQGFSESVKESLLSYTGMTDPHTGRDWGRVVRSGVRADGALELGGNWGAHGLFEFSRLEGEGVADNSAFASDFGLTYELDVEGFEHLAIGPNFHFESYEKNLSQFTSGHGGYFSPDQLFQGMLGLSFLTETGRSWLAEGFVGLGAQSHEVAASPVLPNAPDGRLYDGGSDSSAIFSARLQALFELNPQWRLGAQAGYAKTAAYEDFAVSLYLSFLFDPEWGLDGSDFNR